MKNLKAMLKKGMFKQAAFDDDEQFLITTRDAYREYRAVSLKRRFTTKKPSLKASMPHPDRAKP